MVKQIGLLDYDTFVSKVYFYPNYDVGVTYAYLKQDMNINVRLITVTDIENLKDYDLIYVFATKKDLLPPSSFIRGYYKLPIEEFGPRFPTKPLRPFQLETRYIKPDFTCYNPIISFSLSNPKNRKAWNLDRAVKAQKYEFIRLYEKFEGEDLKKDYPTQYRCVLYDDPVDILNNQDKFDYYKQLVASKHYFLFAQPLDVSRILDTNILEQVMTDTKYANFRKRTRASSINSNIEWLIERSLSEKLKKTVTIDVTLPYEKGVSECFELLLRMIYYTKKTHINVRFRPIYGQLYFENHDLVRLACRYLLGDGYRYMSYYEYVFNICYLRMGVPKELIRQGRPRYDYIMSRYGMAYPLVKLEDWLKTHPQYEEHIFIGGSNYEEIRRKYYDQGRGTITFGARPYYPSQKRSP